MRRLLVAAGLAALAFAIGAYVVYRVAELPIFQRAAATSSTPAPPPRLTPPPRPAPGPGGPQEQTREGLASITFDDGTAGQASFAAPLLEERGLAATYYLISDALGWGGGYISEKQAKRLIAHGHEIGNHTRSHPHLTDLESDAVAAQFGDAQRELRSRLGVTPRTCSYPFGDQDPQVVEVAERYFDTCRTTLGGINTRGGPAHRLVVLNMSADVTPATVRDVAEQTALVDGWLILTYHSVEPGGNAMPEGVDPETFGAQVDALVESGISVRVMSAAAARFGR